MEDLSTAELLEQLKGIALPQAPIEPAVWPLFVASVLCGLALISWLILRRRKPSWVSQATAELGFIEQSKQDNALEKTSMLLKRIAITHENSHTVRQLCGTPWLQHLDHFYHTRYFTRGDGKVFGDTRYQPMSKAKTPDYKKLKRLIKRRQWWI